MSVNISGSVLVTGATNLDPGFPISATAGTTTTINVAIGTALSFSTFSSVTGGNSSVYTYSISSGTLPAGLTLNSAVGVVSGTVNTVQSASPVTFVVRDAFGQQASTTSTVTFTVTPPSFTIQYLVVGGGGAGGAAASPGVGAAGGGGAGGMVVGSYTEYKCNTITIIVGGGGTGTVTPGSPTTGSAGQPGNSSYYQSPTLGNVLALGGGRGGYGYTASPGIPGGSGGGSGTAGTGFQPTSNPGIVGIIQYGNPGQPGGVSPANGSGGGGAGGTSPAPSLFTAGGPGVVWVYTGNTYAAGGSSGGPGVPATPGTGNGGNGQPTLTQPTGTGGSGTVILAVPTPYYPGSAPGGTVTTAPPSYPGITVITYTTPNPTSPATFTYTV